MDGETLRLRRKAMGMLQKDLAEKLGVSQNTIARWERGEVEFPPYLELALKQIESEKKEK